MFKEYIKYLKDNPREYWFRAKLYGWGWTPAKWQGWLTIAVFIVFIDWIATNLASNAAPTNADLTLFFIKLIVAVAALIWICLKTGEKPRWQWGLSSTKKN